MRKLLDQLYLASGALAAASLVGITIIVFGQVALNIIDFFAIKLLGKSFGLLIPSYTSLSGYALAFATFLSLGLGLRKAAHIRVTLLESRLPIAVRKVTVKLITAIAVLLGALFVLGLTHLAYQSYLWGDRGTGLLKEPLWIPQLVISFGALVFLIAAIDTFIELLFTGDSKALDEVELEETM